MSKILVIERTAEWLDLYKKTIMPPHNLRYLTKGKNVASILNKEEYEIILLNLQVEQTGGFGLL